MTALPFDVPVDPDNPTAHDWITQELSKSQYQQGSLLQQILQRIQDWLNSLQVNGTGGPPSSLVLIVVAAIVAALIVAAFFIFGLPRLNQRSSVDGALFGEDDVRDAAALRRDAERAAAAGDYALAIAELFRSIARGLAERTVVTTSPGTTAHDFARQAGVAFPDSASALAAAAVAFDGVRYLDAEGTRAQWDALVALERGLRSARPSFADAGVAS